ncbi:MAG: DUF1566 domain-containing protein [Saprospiraceae bacterium]
MTVTDTITGLMWQKQDGGEMSYDSAVDWVGRLALAGYQDWRLPGIHESFSLMNLDTNPALNKFAFTDTGAEYSRSADGAVNNPSKVWVTNSGGGQGAHLKTETISVWNKKFHARAVRNTHPPNTLQARFKFCWLWCRAGSVDRSHVGKVSAQRFNQLGECADAR